MTKTKNIIFGILSILIMTGGILIYNTSNAEHLFIGKYSTELWVDNVTLGGIESFNLNSKIKSVRLNNYKSGINSINTRTTNYGNGTIIIDKYIIHSEDSSVENFPLSHEVILYNVSGLKYTWIVSNITNWNRMKFTYDPSYTSIINTKDGIKVTYYFNILKLLNETSRNYSEIHLFFKLIDPPQTDNLITMYSGACNFVPKVGDGYSRGQTFVLTNSSLTYISRVQIYFNGRVGSPSNFTLRITNTSSGNLDYTKYYTSVTSNASNIPSTGWYSFDLPQPYINLSNNTLYGVSMVSGDGVGTYYTMCTDTVSSYANGNSSYVPIGSEGTPASWTSSAEDYAMKLYLSDKPTSLATGGITYTSGSYTIHMFLSNDTFRVNSSISNAEVLVVAGGGGGGYAAAGGGGAGGLIYNSSYSFTSGQNVTVIVGSGGIAGASGVSATNGLNSSFGSLIAVGGGFGGGSSGSGSQGNNGGSGGGNGNSQTTPGGNGTAGQGNNGGTGAGAAFFPSGGGGGAGSLGENGTGSTSGAGGNGLNYTISGSNNYYAGGGGGGGTAQGATKGSGGSSVGGDGGISGGNGVDGVAYTGSGGGGGGNGGNGGAGGSGIVIVKYLSTQQAPYTLNINNITTYNTSGITTNFTYLNIINHSTVGITSSNLNISNVSSTNFTLYYPNGTILINSANMTLSNNSGNSTVINVTYYYNLTNISLNVIGQWNISVTVYAGVINTTLTSGFNVTNIPPNNPVANITPSTVYSGSIVQGYCNSTDNDSNNVSYNYIWYINNTLITAGNTGYYTPGLNVNVANYTVTFGNNITLGCRATDGLNYSSYSNSSTLNISSNALIQLLNISLLNYNISQKSWLEFNNNSYYSYKILQNNLSPIGQNSTNCSYTLNLTNYTINMYNRNDISNNYTLHVYINNSILNFTNITNRTLLINGYYCVNIFIDLNQSIVRWYNNVTTGNNTYTNKIYPTNITVN